MLPPLDPGDEVESTHLGDLQLNRGDWRLLREV